jgi:multicomponent Na+:H+ antiporter subunit E
VKAFLLRQGLYVLGLTAVWVMLWDRVSVANIASGVLVAVVLLVVFPTRRQTGQVGATVIRPLAIARLLGYVAVQLVVSNWLVAREIVSRRSHIRTGIVACRLHTTSPNLITLISSILEISPGTMTVELRAEPPTLYLHVLMLRDVLDARRSVAHLESLVLRAFGTASDVIDPVHPEVGA